jgi:hypothetical protein
MSAGTSFSAVWFLPAQTPLTRRSLVYFAPGAYTYALTSSIAEPIWAVVAVFKRTYHAGSR